MNLLQEQEEQEALLLSLGESRLTGRKAFQQKEKGQIAFSLEEVGFGKVDWNIKGAFRKDLEWGRVQGIGQKQSYDQNGLRDIAGRLVETAVWAAGREESSSEGIGIAGGVRGQAAIVTVEKGAQILPVLYQKLRQGRLRTLEDESHRVTVELTEQQTSGLGMDVKDLDRVFQRDARRYDGGLTLL